MEEMNDPRAIAKARESHNILTQAFIEPEPLFDIEMNDNTNESFNGKIYDRLRKLNIKVINDENDEPFFFIGDMTHFDFMKVIEEEWGKSVVSFTNYN